MTLLPLLLPVLALAAASAPPPRADAEAAAQQLFLAQEWKGAAEAYQNVVAAEPTDGRAWFRLGVCRFHGGEAGRSIAAFERAVELRFQAPMAAFMAARAAAGLGEAPTALDWLGRAVEAGFAQVDLLRASTELQALAGDPRFEALLAATERAAAPCLNEPEPRRLAFWVGSWDVIYLGARIATSTVERLENGCLYLETYAQPGASSRSLHYYHRGLGRWRQVYVDGLGGVGEYSGEFRDGALHYAGEFRTGGGELQLYRMSYRDLGAAGVEQVAEASTDGGKTWALRYDILYRPQTPGRAG
jgi:tetratricopeptide (TPR) repeat protein